MKTSIYILALVAVCFGCKKPEPDNGKPGTPLVRTDFYATVHNRPWDATLSAAQWVNGQLRIAATPENGTVLEIKLRDSIPGTYFLNDTSLNTAIYQTDTVEYNSKDSGSFVSKVVITKYDAVNRTISGTFSLVLANSINKYKIGVEDGNFTDISLGNPPPIYTGDTLFMGWYTNGAKQGLYYILENQTSRIQARRLITRSNTFLGGNQSYFNTETMEYTAFPDSGSGSLIQVTTGQELMTYGVQNCSGPTQVGVQYYRYEANHNVGLSSFRRSNGSFFTLITNDTITPLPHQTTNGVLIYQSNGKVFKQVDPSTSATVGYMMPAMDLLSLDYEAPNSFLAVKSVEQGNVVAYHLIRLNIVGSAIQESFLVNLNLTNYTNAGASFTLDKRNGIHYTTFVSDGQTQCRAYTKSTGSLRSFTIAGELTGVEAKF